MWLYKNKKIDEIPTAESPTGYYGFVYQITNCSNDKKYIGKKQFYFTKYRQVNKKRKKYQAESDWLNYNGSNSVLLEEMKSSNPILQKEILYFCRTKSELSYLETLEILRTGALLREDYYNDWVSCKITRRHLNKVKDSISEKLQIF